MGECKLLYKVKCEECYWYATCLERLNREDVGLGICGSFQRVQMGEVKHEVCNA